MNRRVVPLGEPLPSFLESAGDRRFGNRRIADYASVNDPIAPGIVVVVLIERNVTVVDRHIRDPAVDAIGRRIKSYSLESAFDGRTFALAFRNEPRKLKPRQKVVTRVARIPDTDRIAPANHKSAPDSEIVAELVGSRRKVHHAAILTQFLLRRRETCLKVVSSHFPDRNNLPQTPQSSTLHAH